MEEQLLGRCSVLQCVKVCCRVQYVPKRRYYNGGATVGPLQCVAVCCGVFAMRCSVLQYVPKASKWMSNRRAVAVCCSVLQSVAVCCSMYRSEGMMIEEQPSGR